MKYEYLVVPFTGKIKTGEGANIAGEQLQWEIRKYVEDGYEFVQLGEVSIEVQPGCLAAFFGQKAAYIRCDQIIFRCETSDLLNGPRLR